MVDPDRYRDREKESYYETSYQRTYSEPRRSHTYGSNYRPYDSERGSPQEDYRFRRERSYSPQDVSRSSNGTRYRSKATDFTDKPKYRNNVWVNPDNTSKQKISTSEDDAGNEKGDKIQQESIEASQRKPTTANEQVTPAVNNAHHTKQGQPSAPMNLDSNDNNSAGKQLRVQTQFANNDTAALTQSAEVQPPNGTLESLHS